jgi:hypothetical protein
VYVSQKTDYEERQIVSLPAAVAEPGDGVQKTLLDFCSRQLPLAASPFQYSFGSESFTLRVL